MKVVILGCSGMLGSALAKQLDYRFEVVGISRSKHPLSSYICDFTDLRRLSEYLDRIGADVIVNVAAITNLNYCESHIYDAFSLHFELSKMLAQRSEKTIYISTDSVFDGEHGNYDELSKVRPLNVYAMSKLLGEAPVLEAGGLVLRTNIYGFNKYKPGNSLFEWAVSNITSKAKMTGYTDICFNPVSVFALSEIIEFCISHNYSGLFNIGSNKPISKADFLKHIVKLVDSEYKLLSFAEQPSSVIRRPKNTMLNVNKSDLFNLPKVDFLDDLKRVVTEYFSISTF